MITEFFFLLLVWFFVFEYEEVVIDEVVFMDVFDVGWGDILVVIIDDIGWVIFDSFIDIRMVFSRFVLFFKEVVNC